MLNTKDLKELQEFCDTLSVVKIHDLFNQLLYEYKQYMKSGTPEECAQRKEVTDIKTETVIEKKVKKRGRSNKFKEVIDTDVNTFMFDKLGELRKD